MNHSCYIDIEVHFFEPIICKLLPEHALRKLDIFTKCPTVLGLYFLRCLATRRLQELPFSCRDSEIGTQVPRIYSRVSKPLSQSNIKIIFVKSSFKQFGCTEEFCAQFNVLSRAAVVFCRFPIDHLIRATWRANTRGAHCTATSHKSTWRTPKRMRDATKGRRECHVILQAPKHSQAKAKEQAKKPSQPLPSSRRVCAFGF